MIRWNSYLVNKVYRNLLWCIGIWLHKVLLLLIMWYQRKFCMQKSYFFCSVERSRYPVMLFIWMQSLGTRLTWIKQGLCTWHVKIWLNVARTISYWFVVYNFHSAEDLFWNIPICINHNFRLTHSFKCHNIIHNCEYVYNDKNKLLNWHIRILKASNGNGLFNGHDLPEDCSLDQIISHLFKWNDALKSSSN